MYKADTWRCIEDNLTHSEDWVDNAPVTQCFVVLLSIKSPQITGSQELVSSYVSLIYQHIMFSGRGFANGPPWIHISSQMPPTELPKEKRRRKSLEKLSNHSFVREEGQLWTYSEWGGGCGGWAGLCESGQTQGRMSWIMEETCQDQTRTWLPESQVNMRRRFWVGLKFLLWGLDCRFYCLDTL